MSFVFLCFPLAIYQMCELFDLFYVFDSKKKTLYVMDSYRNICYISLICYHIVRCDFVAANEWYEVQNIYNSSAVIILVSTVSRNYLWNFV